MPVFGDSILAACVNRVSPISGRLGGGGAPAFHVEKKFDLS